MAAEEVKPKQQLVVAQKEHVGSSSGKQQGNSRANAKKRRKLKKVKKPRKGVTDLWSGKDFAVEGIMQLTREKRWVELRVLKKWWKTYALWREESLIEALRETLGKEKEKLIPLNQKAMEAGAKCTEA